MFRSRVAWTIVALAVTPAWGIVSARALDEKPEDVLKSHGLSVKRGGSTYVLVAEGEVQSKLNEALRVFKQLSFALTRQHEFDQNVVSQKRIVPELLQERILRNQQLRAINQQDVIQHNQLVARLNEINDQLRLIDGMTADPRVKQEIDKVVSQRRADYIQAILDLRALVDSTTRQYAELAQNDKITTAIATLASQTKSPLKLGPSRGFDESVKQLVNREKFVLSKAVEMRQRGGVFERR
jgi:hypothetical protein